MQSCIEDLFRFIQFHLLISRKEAATQENTALTNHAKNRLMYYKRVETYSISFLIVNILLFISSVLYMKKYLFKGNSYQDDH